MLLPFFLYTPETEACEGEICVSWKKIVSLPRECNFAAGFFIHLPLMRISLELNWENGFDRLIAIVLLWCMTLCAAAVEKSFSSEFIGADLAHGRTPQCALRDHMGFLWVGTHSGLACYDGNGQNVYEPVGGVVPSTEGMNVSALFELGDDILFGGTPGLCVFRRRSNTSSVFPMRTRYGVPVSSPVRKILDADGGAHIWIFTRDRDSSFMTQPTRL